MPVTLEDVRAELERDEPDYARAATWGEEALPHLAALVAEGRPHVAPKAVFLASLIRGDESTEIVARAADSTDVDIRLAAAAAARNLPAAEAPSVAERLLADEDIGVRKLALKSIDALGAADLRPRLEQLAKDDPEPALRRLASDISERMP